MLVSLLADYSLWGLYGWVMMMSIFSYTILAGGVSLHLRRHQLSYQPYKTQTSQPKSSLVWQEYREGCLSCLPAALNVTLSIYGARQGWNLLVDDFGALSPFQHLWSLFFMILITEIFEWSFHYASHRFDLLWSIHKRHHLYPNPTPFAVLSDHPLDMWIKSSPLLWIPLIVPIYDLTIFGWFFAVNLVYGIYLHSGYEFPFLPPRDSKYFSSSWHHNVHHSHHLDCNFGFFTRFLDHLFGTAYN